MKTSPLKRMAVLMLAAMIGSPTLLLANDKKESTDKKPATDTASAASAAPKTKLDDNENPLLIGKRNINKNLLPTFYSLEKEVALGRQLAAEVDRQAKFIDDPIITEYINRVGQNVVLHSDAKVPFTIKVLDSDDVNAFALPGGFFYVNKGLILAAENEAEIAGVMAHEIAHVASRHGVEQASKAQLANYAMIPLIFMTGGLGAIAYQAAQIGVPLAFLKFSRGMEAEADRLGAQYAWAAGYDPNNLVTFFEKLEKKEKGKPGTLSKLFRSHPPTPDRIDKVRSLVVRFPDRDEYTVNTSEFNRVKTRLLAITNSKSIDPSNRDSGPKRPTLKRRKEGEDPNQPSPSEEQPKDRPTLKRRDSDGKPSDTSKPPEKL
ncbi:MAG TPA: M48 family metallopeptidase [Blastocatellia bacterium]|nr:M48 family metallopeptidase [Blastocatellia bacterium]